MGLFTRSKKKEAHISDFVIYELLNQFTDASLEMPIRRVRNLFEYESCYPLVFGYFLGAMDYIIEYKDIDSKNAERLFQEYLSVNFTNEDRKKANELYDMFTDLDKTVEGRSHMIIGRNAFKKWLENQPEIIPELNRMLYDAYIR